MHDWPVTPARGTSRNSAQFADAAHRQRHHQRLGARVRDRDHRRKSSLWRRSRTMGVVSSHRRMRGRRDSRSSRCNLRPKGNMLSESALRSKINFAARASLQKPRVRRRGSSWGPTAPLGATQCEKGCGERRYGPLGPSK